MTKPKPSKDKEKSSAGATSNKKANSKASARSPNIEWAKHPNWTWSLITYLSDHPTFRTKLFSDSTADAAKENHSKAVAKDGKPQQYAVLAKHIFENEPEHKDGYKLKPSRFTTSVETRLRR